MTDSDIKWLETTSWWQRACQIVEELEQHDHEPAMVAVPAPMLVGLVEELKRHEALLVQECNEEYDTVVKLRRELKAAREETERWKRIAEDRRRALVDIG